MGFENSALLIKLQIGKWTGKKDDKDGERELAKAHNVLGKFGEVRKDLIASVAFKPITEAESEIRSLHARLTQPWATGIAILPSGVYFEYMGAISAKRDGYYQAVDRFVAQYDVLKSDSKLRLGDKYNEEEYPSKDELREKFYVQLDVLPLANSSSIVLNLADAEVQKIKLQYESTLKDMENKSVESSWGTLSALLDNLLERLKDPTYARLDTMERVKDTTKLVQSMNVMKIAALDAVCDDILNLVCICSMDDIKNDVVIQQEVMDRSKEVRAKIDLVRPQK